MRIFGVETEPIEERISGVKQRIPEPGFEWYRYHSLTNLIHLKKLLGKSEGRVIEKARHGGVLDIGCGDGELSFLFEAMGCRVDAVDHPIPNHNGMLGVRRLAKELSSAVQIHEVDLDSQFSLPRDRYGLAVFLGLLYHLKNPLYALEQIARHADYALLSTRVARKLPNGVAMPEGQPLAYLLGSEELNQDDSNYWIFSDAGLRRILKRAHWEVVEWLSVGDTVNSDPVSLDHDERAFCLLRSHHSMSHAQLVQGWHHAEASGWRWTERRFSARFELREGERPGRLALKVYFAPEVFEKLGAVVLGGRINGVEFVPARLDSSGDHSIVRSLHHTQGDILAEFELDKAFRPTVGEPRELGIIVASLELE